MMKRMLKIVWYHGLFIYISVALTQNVHAQQTKDTTLKLSLQQARDYALQNSPVIKNANLDLEGAKKKIWETTAIGLPQVNSKLAYSYQLTVPDQIKQFSGLSNLGAWMYGADQALAGLTNNPQFGHIPPVEPQEPTDEKDLKWGLTYDITVSQIIFSGGYIVGLQTSKTFKQLSQINITKSQNDLLENVSNAYFLHLIVCENKLIIDSIYKNTEKVLNDLTIMRQKGFMEETDIDQLQLTLSNIKNTKDMIDRQCEITANLLKFQLGIELLSKVELTDKLDMIINTVNVEALASKEFKLENYSDYQFLETQEKLAKLNLKFTKSAFLPEIVGFYNHQENFNDKSFSFTPPNIIGLNVSIPIFGSGMKLAKVQQAKISLDKAQNSKYMAGLGLNLQFSEARSAYITALNKSQTNKQNVELAQKIYNRSLIKYKEGMLSSLELTQAQTQYLQAQSNYFASIIELSNAYSKLDKMLK